MVRTARSIGDFILPLLIFAAVWQIGSSFLPRNVLPSVVEIVAATWDMATSSTRFPILLDNLGSTLGRIYAGLVIGAVIGVAIGFAMARVTVIEDGLSPILGALYPLPKPALLPLAIMWFGLGGRAIVATTVMSAAVPIIVTTFNGVRSVPRTLIWSAKSLGASRRKLAIGVLLPFASPQMIVGLRIAHNLAVVSVVAGELVVSQSGIGFMIGDFGNAGIYELMFGTVLILVVVVALLDRIVDLVSRALLHWYYWSETPQ